MQIKPLVLASIVATSLIFMGCPAKTETPPVTASPEFNTYTLDLEMAYSTAINPNPKCFIDLDKGVVYDVQTAAAHAADIDIVWTFTDNSLMYLSSIAQNQFSTASDGFNATSLGYGNWSVRNHCIIGYGGSLAKSEFSGIKTRDELYYSISNSLQYVHSDYQYFDGSLNTFTNVYVFETNLQKRGGFIVNSNNTNSNGGRANITIKVLK